ncbi:hypothetical protein OAE82_01065, partial [bacterium]|nr:hypothetical protein [bacterium]
TEALWVSRWHQAVKGRDLGSFDAFLTRRRKTIWEMSRAASSFLVIRRATEWMSGRCRSTSSASAGPEGLRKCF